MTEQLEFDFSQTPEEAAQRDLARRLEQTLGIGRDSPDVRLLVLIWARGTYRDGSSAVMISTRELAGELRLGRAAVMEAIARLHSQGVLDVLKGCRPNAYRILWSDLWSGSRSSSPAAGADKINPHDLFDGQCEAWTVTSRNAERGWTETARPDGRLDGRSVGRLDGRSVGRDAVSSYHSEGPPEGGTEEEEDYKLNSSSSSSHREMVGALESLDLTRLVLAGASCRDSELCAALDGALDVALTTDQFRQLIGAFIRARQLKPGRWETYIAACLRRGVDGKLQDDAAKLIEAWRQAANTERLRAQRRRELEQLDPEFWPQLQAIPLNELAAACGDDDYLRQALLRDGEEARQCLRYRLYQLVFGVSCPQQDEMT